MERYSELLSSNSPPELAELAAIQEDINTRAKRIGRLQLELQRLDAERRRIEEEWLRAQEEHEALHSLLSPLRRFPAETLSEIFMAVYNNADWHSYYKPDETTTRVVQVCRVSKRWRDVAIGTPGLWSSLILLPSDRFCLNIAKISSWLERSANVARHLELRELKRCRHGTDTGHCRLPNRWSLGKLLSEGPVLHSLHLNGVYPECLQELAQHMKDQRADATRPWDSLKCLTLSLGCRGETPSTLDLSHLPLVRSLRLQNHPGHYKGLGPVPSPPADDAFLPNLTSLIIRGMAIRPIFELLPFCTDLQELTMEPYYQVGNELRGNKQPCLLPNVRTLRLEDWTRGQVKILPKLLRTPALVDLLIRFDESRRDVGDGSDEDSKEDPIGMIDGFTSFIEGSEATVQRLRIEELYTSSRSLQRMLMNASSVVDLTFDNVQEIDFTHFLPSANPASEHRSLLLPRLTSLRLVSMIDDLGIEELCDIFARGVTRHSTFKTLNFEVGARTLRSYETMQSNDLRSAVSRLRKLGVDVFVSSDMER